MQEIVPDVLTWSRLSERHGYDFNGHLVRHPEGNLCIDPVEPSAAELDQLAEIGATRIVLTNRNHTRATNLMRHGSAPVPIHPDDADYARGQGAEIDDALAVGDRLGPLQVVGVPGKSRRGRAVLGGTQAADRRRRADRQSARPLRVTAEKVMDNPVQLKQSITKLLALDFDTLLMGDGVSILAHGKDRLRELAASSRG